MNARYACLLGLTLVALLITSSLALYYRNQSVHFQREWSTLVAKLGETPDEGRVSSRALVAPGVDMPSRAPSSRGHDVQSSHPTESVQPDEDAVPADSSDVPMREDHSSDWWEQLRKTNPEAYETMMRRREESLQRRQQTQNRAQDAWNQTTNYFANRKTSGMNQKQLAEYNRMLALLGQTRELQKMQPGLAPDERRVAASAIQSNMVALTSMLENERNREYHDLAVAMGQSEADAAAFVGYINQIISNTTVRVIFPEVLTRGVGRGPRGGKSR